MTDPVADFSAYQDGVFKDLMSSVKTASAIAAQDVDFLRSSNPELATALDAANARILGLANRLLGNAVVGSDVGAPKLESSEDVENKWDDVVEVADFLLERADTCLDEYTGAIKQKNPEPGPNARITPRATRSNYNQKPRPPQSAWKLVKNLPKPQLKFEVKPDNNDPSPFRPLLTTKPHALVPLEESLKTTANEGGRERYAHPYEAEIAAMDYPDRVFRKQEPIQYLPFEDTTAALVDTPEALADMLGDLKEAKEIAIDLEHHDQRSYVGFTCLMQISTREKDWIVDTLQLRSELQILNEVFADPKIIKVLHGASMDIIWLQRDFGLYVVGLFDTYHAARSLGFAGHGLAFLLKKYVDFDADKQYQLADWRIRPLPEEMFDYARSDTHFLLYCFDNLRNELLDRSDLKNPENNKMRHVLQNSKEVALRLYEKEYYDAETGSGPLGWNNMLFRGDNLDELQRAVFKAVHAWRDRVARDEDESLHYVMPRHQLFGLARQVPTDVPGVLTVCVPASQPVRLRVSDLAAVIKKAKEDCARSMANRQLPEASNDPESAPVEIVPTSGNESPADVPKLPVDGKALRAEVSGFWGGVAGSSRWQMATERQKIADDEVTLAVPLPQLTAAVFVSADEPRGSAPTKGVDPGARAEHEYVKNREKRNEDEVLVVRSLGGGRKRKSEEISRVEGPEADDSSIAVKRGTEEKEEGPQIVEKASLEASGEDSHTPDAEPAGKKKRRKKAKDDSRQGPEVAERPFQPFDYANAPPMLNDGGNERGDKGKSKGKKKKVFDPYSKSMDAPKGLGKGQRERAGKSATFKR